MPKIGYFQVSIVDTKSGTPFEEFKPKVNEQDGQAECYIQCQTGTEFKIRVGLDSSFKHTVESFVTPVAIDGKRLASKFLGWANKRIWLENEMKGVYTSASQFAPFVFGHTLFTGEKYLCLELSLLIQRGRETQMTRR